MTSVSLPWRGLCAAACLALAAGCSSGSDAQQSGLADALSLVAAALTGEQEEALDLPPGVIPQLDPALFANVTDPVLFAWIEELGAIATLGRAEDRAGVSTWFSGNRSSLSLAGGGVLVASRGFGADLLVADVSGVVAAIESGRAAEVQRVHRQLDGLYDAGRMEFRCTVQPIGRESIQILGQTHATLRIEENCAGAETSFTNIYWRDAQKSLIRQSRQWVNPAVGVITLQRLVE